MPRRPGPSRTGTRCRARCWRASAGRRQCTWSSRSRSGSKPRGSRALTAGSQGSRCARAWGAPPPRGSLPGRFGGPAGVNGIRTGLGGPLSGAPLGGAGSLGTPGLGGGLGMATVGPMGGMSAPGNAMVTGGGLLQMGYGGDDLLTGSPSRSTARRARAASCRSGAGAHDRISPGARARCRSAVTCARRCSGRTTRRGR